MGLAYLYKETALLVVLPLFLYVVYKRRWRNGYLAAAAGFAVVVAVEMATFGIFFEDPLFRVHSLEPKVVTTAPKIVTTSVGHRALYPPVRPGGVLFSPAVSLVTNQEYGLFYFFIPWAMIALILRRDKASAPLLLFFLVIGLYTLWGPTSFSVYRHLRSLERYLLPITIPGLLLLARWIWLCLRGKWRWTVVALLVTSWLVCIHVDNSRTFRSIGDKLQAFQSEHSDKTLVLHPYAYMCLFVAHGLEPVNNAAVLEFRKTSGHARRIDPAIEVYTDETKLRDCYVAVAIGGAIHRPDAVPSEWREVTRCMRDRLWFVGPMNSIGGMPAKIGNKLSPEMGYVIYDVSE